MKDKKPKTVGAVERVSLDKTGLAEDSTKIYKYENYRDKLKNKNSYLFCALKPGNISNRVSKEAGITVMTLAVTIIVMLILSAVAINVGIGEDGIINRAENAVDKYKEAAQNEKEAMDSISSQLDDILSGIDNPVEDIDESPAIEITGWNSTGGVVTLEVKEGYSAEYQIEGEEWISYTEGSQITVENGKKISVRYYTEEGTKGKITSKIIRDEVSPSIKVSIEEETSSTIRIKAVAEDKEMGIDESLGYKYYIRKTGEKEYEYKGQNTTGEYEYTNLEAQTNYEILVTANDLGGNTGSGKAEGITEEGEAPTLVEEQNIRITKTPEALTKENVIVKVELIGIDSKYYIEYSEGNTSNYVRYKNQIEVENNETIYVRINDGNKASNAIQVNIDNIDKELPQVQVGLGSKTSNSITVNIEVTDNEGELEGQEYVYKIKKTTETSYTQTYTSSNKTYVFTNLMQNTGYDIEVEAKDVVGNVGKGNLLNQVTEEVTSGLEEGAIKFTNPSWTNGVASIQVSTNTSYKIEYQLNGTEGAWTKIANNGTIDNLAHNTNIYARLTDGINSGEYASTSIKDTTKPEVSISLGTITSNSIQVQVTANDKETGLADKNTYEYFLNNSSQGATENNTHTFSNLFDDTSYTLKVKVLDKVGNSQEAEVTGKTKLVPAGTTSGSITFTSPTWSGGKASIKVSTNTSYKIEYQVNGTTGTWTEIASGGTISNLAHNTNVYARLTDGINSGEYASTSIKDTVSPEVSIATSNITQTSVKLTVTASDNQSGLADSGRYTYYLNNTQKASNNTNSYTYTGLTASTKYTLKVVVKDKAGKTTEKSTTVTTAAPPVDNAATVAKNPSTYYGAEVTGYTCTNSAAVSKWRIFYADSTNIYLIADDYIPNQYAPNSAGGHAPNKNGTYKADFSSVYRDYSGSAWINTNSKGKKWLSQFLNSYGTSTNKNIRSVAYMMDTNVWSTFAGTKAEYAMGGPTLELFCASYKQTHPSKYIDYNIGNSNGYEIKLSTGSSYSSSVGGLPQNDFNQIYIKSDTSKADGMWLASPSSYSSNGLLSAYYSGYVNGSGYSYYDLGFRPLVCLKSDVRLKKTSDGVYAIQ